MSRYILVRVRPIVCALFVVLLSTSSGHAPILARQQPAEQTNGRSVTVLPDGSRLLIGGDATGGLVAIEDAASGRTIALDASPIVPRAWHTATLLADGTVLLVGGIDSNGRRITTPERFKPASHTFEQLPIDGLAARAHHTATLLTDGRVLIAGGESAGGAGDADIWNPETESATPLAAAMREARVGHRATLLADGRVLFEGGAAPAGEQGQDEVFDPESGTFSVDHVPVRPVEAAFVAGSAPSPGETEVPVDGRLAIRFSRTVAPRSVSAESVTVVGPSGPIALVVIPAEAGRLAFAWPSEPLAPATSYRLTVNGAVTDDGQAVRRFSMAFTTVDAPAESRDRERDPDAEDWDPRARGRRAWTVEAGASPWQMLPPLRAMAGVTALAGQALTLAGRPLADVTLTVAGLAARTDKTGRFLIELPNSAAGRQQLEIDGSTANQPGRTYGFFEVAVTLHPGATTVLPYTVWMTKIDTANAVRLPAPATRDMVITTPRIPGLELHLPRGTVIKDRDGRVVREVSITAIPVDRPPFPLPGHIEVPVYFTIQPGGAVVYNASYRPRKARLIYPNYHEAPKDVIASFWHYDPEELDWYVYGAGKVTGQQVVPDEGVGIYEFTGAMMDSTDPPPNDAPEPGGGPALGDPVDVGTGIFLMEKTDLFLPDVLPIALTRTYRPKDPTSRPFGRGSTHPYMMRLWSAQNYQQADLILPDGGRIHYVRISPGTGFTTAIYEHTESPTAFYRSRIAWNGHGWDLTLRDGTVYVFGDFAPLQSIRDRHGNTITVEHSNGQNGNVTRVMSQNGRWISFSYDSSDRITQAQDNIGRTIGYQYDASGRLWKVTDAEAGVTEYTYDAFHRLLTIKDARGIVYLTNTYDANGRIATQTQADGTTWAFAYTLNSSGRVTQADVTDPRGHISRSTFNTDGYQLAFVEALGLPEERTTTYTRATTSNLVTSVTDPLSRQTNYSYDPNGKVTSITRLAGTSEAVTTSFTYSSSYDQVATVTDPLNHTTGFTYDSSGRLTTVTDPLSQTTTFTYNAAGQPLTISNGANETASFGYERGDLVSTTDPLSRSTLRYLDAAGRLLRVSDPLGRSTLYEHSALNQVTKVVDSLGGETTFTYDPNGNLLTLTDARGKTTAWTYDSMDRTATRTDPLTRAESFTYNGNGAVSTWTDRKGQVTEYRYDALDRQTFIGFGRTGSSPTYSYASTIATTFDAGDRATAVVDSMAGTIDLTYDLLDRLIEEDTPEGAIAYGYDDAGRRTSMQVAGQTAVAYTYDNADRLTGITQGAAAVAMGYDTAGRRTSLTLPNGIIVEYGYDPGSQLTGLTYKLSGAAIGDLSYTYDAGGQRVAVSGTFARTGLPPALGSATYDDANQIAVWGGTTFAYDANGNLTSDGTKTYNWNTRNELSGISGGVAASFSYDGLGRRRAKTVSGTTTQFLYDGLNPVQELTGGTPTANLLTGFGYDEFFTRTDSAGVRSFLSDALGSSVALTDGSGTLQTEYTYEPFGATTTSGASTTNAFGFTGRETDGTGLMFYRARYYDPRLQRFVSDDPIGFASGTTNLQQYADSNPVLYGDPLGLCPVCPIVVVAKPAAVVTAAALAAATVAAIQAGRALAPHVTRAINEISVHLAQRGKRNVRDTGLENVGDAELARLARDRSLHGAERARYQKEEKARRLRNQQKRGGGSGQGSGGRGSGGAGAAGGGGAVGDGGSEGTFPFSGCLIPWGRKCG